jgi:DNA transformation protein
LPNPLKVTPPFRSFVLDQLAGLGGVTPRSMFGGIGLYRDGVFFGIVAGDMLYLRADDRSRPVYEAAGSHPFKPYPHRPGTMAYYSVPPSVLECAPDLARWARMACAAARSATGATDSTDTKRRPRR